MYQKVEEEINQWTWYDEKKRKILLQGVVILKQV